VNRLVLAVVAVDAVLLAIALKWWSLSIAAVFLLVSGLLLWFGWRRRRRTGRPVTATAVVSTFLVAVAFVTAAGALVGYYG
jgi:peptidoglycan/LPS O-acetylase OafA/YrhL